MYYLTRTAILHLLACCIVGFAVANPLSLAIAQTNNSYPMLMSIRPTAACIGQASMHEIHARYNLAGATQVMVSGTGVVGEVVVDEKSKPEDAARNDINDSICKLQFTVAADALPGLRDIRILTPHGASTIGQLMLVRDPVVIEAGDNDSAANAQNVELPLTYCGAIEKAEDVDFIRFHLEEGTSWTFHVMSQRLLNRLHDMQTRIDPMISLRGPNGTLLASADNFYAGDPLLHWNCTQSGDYTLEVRDVRYQGNADWMYSIEIHDRPFVTQIHPLAISLDTPTQVSLVGYHFDAKAVATVTLPNGVEPGIGSTSLVVDGRPSNQVVYFGTHLPIHNELMSGPIVVPSVLVGRIDQPVEVDRFEFEAKAQTRFNFRAYSRRLMSAMDPVLRILNEKGDSLIENDDATVTRVNQSDPWIENWTAPADGKYTIEIRDLHQRGGPSFGYAIEVTQAEPYFLLEADTDKTQLAPGMGSVLYVRGLRKNGMVGDIQLAVEGLPGGVQATPGRILADGTDGCIIFNASGDAPLSASNIRIMGIANVAPKDQPPKLLQVMASPLQEYYSPGGGRGNYPVETHTLSVAKPMDIRAIHVSQEAVELKPGGSQRIEVSVERAPDFKGNVTLDLILQHLEQPYGNSLPKGVTVDPASSKTLLTGEESKGFITITAAADAPLVDRQLVPINVHVSINFVMKHTFCAGPFWISVVNQKD